MPGQLALDAPDDYEEALMAANAALAMGPRSARQLAAWASEGLTPQSPPAALAKCALRSRLLADAALAARAAKGPGAARWALAAPDMAAGWALGLGLGDEADAAARALTSTDQAAAALAMARSGVAREAARHALFPILAADPEELPLILHALAEWLSAMAADSGALAHLAGAQALMGLREGFEEASAEQGANGDDLDRARAAAARLSATLSPGQRELARVEYMQLTKADAAFAREFLP